MISLPPVDQVAERLFGLMAEADIDGNVDPHVHVKAQLLHVVQGAVTIIADDRMWTVPPNCALWIPGGVPHAGRGFGHIHVESLYMDSALMPAMGPRCAIIAVSPLLRELIGRFMNTPRDARQDLERRERLAVVLLDELGDAPREIIEVPMPSDPRLRRLVETMIEQPSLRVTIEAWGARVGASERTLNRLFRKETGLSLGMWRQQLHISLALRLLAEGAAVSTIANSLGYESVSAFITMFRRIMGTTPSRYFRESSPAI